MIIVVDSGVANLRSVANALTHLGVKFAITQDPAEIASAHKIILPGVGAFAAGMQTLAQRGLIVPLQQRAAAGIPFLGICLGMQMIFERSEENGSYAGLGLIPGTIVRFPSSDLKVPHMGWNTLHLCRPSPLIAGVEEGNYAYFVHSYYAALTDPKVALATTDYGVPFPAIVQYNNVYGAQFHPEKSQKTGLTLLKNFAAL